MVGQVVHILFLCFLGQWLDTANEEAWIYIMKSVPFYVGCKVDRAFCLPILAIK